MFQVKKNTTGQKSSPKAKATRKSQHTEEDNLNLSSNNDELPTPSPPEKDIPEPKTRKSTTKKEKNKVSPDEEKEFMQNVSTTVKTLGDLVGAQKSQASTSGAQSNPEEDDRDIWAKLLAKKVRRMEPMDGEEFMLKVDTLALTYLKK